MNRCLFIKTWTLYRVYKSAAQLKKTNLTPMYIVKGIGLYLACEIVLLIVWTIVDRPKAKFHSILTSSFTFYFFIIIVIFLLFLMGIRNG